MCPRREDRARRRARALRRTLGAPESPAGKVAPDPLEFLARLITHIPDRGQVMTRYYGWYASRTRRVRRRQAADSAQVEEPVAITDPVSWSLRAARRSSPGSSLPAPGSLLPASHRDRAGFRTPPLTDLLRH